MAGYSGLARFASGILRGRQTLMQELAEVYKPAINRNREKIKEMIKEKAGNATKTELARKIKVLKGFYTLEMAPPSRSELKKLGDDLILLKDFIKSGAVAHLTVKQAWLLFLVGLEIGLWFFIGETIAKGRIVGYKV